MGNPDSCSAKSSEWENRSTVVARQRTSFQEIQDIRFEGSE